MSKPSKAYHHGDLANALLTAAAEAIEASGVAAVSLRDIARRAGVSHGAPAHHFKDKAGLLTALATQGHLILRDALIAACARHPDDSREAFCASGVAYVLFAVEHRAHFEVMFQPELQNRANAELALAAASSYQVLLDAIAAAQRDDYISKHDTESQAIASWALVHGLAQLWFTSNLPKEGGRAELERLAWRVVHAYSGSPTRT
jgi:AcrR family transcriptional regulator